MKNKFTATLPLALLAIGALGSVTSANAADLNNSIYVALDTPCRVGDTRNTSTPSIPAAGSVEWFAYGTDMSGQGGAASPGCEDPKTDDKILPISALLNITGVGVDAVGNGSLSVFPADGAANGSSLLNVTQGTNIANSTIVGLCNDGTCDGKFIIEANHLSVPVVADVQGYFYARPSGVAQVAVRGGDYSSPVDAMNDLADWCGVPSQTNRCLMDIAPGEYDLGGGQIVMQRNVDIRGAGRSTTAIIGAVSTDTGDETSAVIVTNDGKTASLSDLSVLNRGGSDYSIGIFIKNGNPNIRRVNTAAFGGTNANYGIFNVGSPTVEDVSANGMGIFGGENAYGVWFKELGGSWVHVHAKGDQASSDNVGVYVSHISHPRITASWLWGFSAGVLFEDSRSIGARLVYNRISGGTVNPLPTPAAKQVCRGNYDDQNFDVDCTKPPPKPVFPPSP